MKKQLLFFMLATLTACTAFSQTGFHAGVQFGFNGVAVLNQNRYGFASDLDYDLKFGIYPGVAFGYNFQKNAGVQVEINFAQMGQNYFDKVRDFYVDTTNQQHKLKVETFRFTELNYLHIPILFRYQTSKVKKDIVEFHAMAGPVIGLLLSADQRYEADIYGDGNVVEIPIDQIEATIPPFAATEATEEPIDYFNPIDIGFQLDLGVDLYLNENWYLTPAAKFYIGLTDNSAEETRGLYPEYGASHNAFGGINIGIHYLAAEKKK